MTERWKRELSKIDRLEPGDGLLERAQHGPTRGDPGPSRSSRALTIAVAFAAVAVAGFIVVRAFGLPGSGTQVASDVTPTAVIDAGPMPWMAVSKENPAVTLSALHTGKLFERNGCLVMGDGQTLPVWPTQFWMMQSDGKPFVMEEQGNAVAALGEDMRMGGGYVPWRNDIEGLQQTLAEPIPEACLKDLRNVWMVGETHPLMPPLSPEQQLHLLDYAQHLAKRLGDPAAATRAKAVYTEAMKLDSMDLGVFESVDPVPGEPWVVVQMLGDFRSYGPGTTEDLGGSALWFVVPVTDPMPERVPGWGLTTTPIDLQVLGDPVQLGLVPTKYPPLEVTPRPPASPPSIPAETGTREDVEKVWLLLNEAQEVYDEIVRLEEAAKLSVEGEAHLETNRERLRWLLDQAEVHEQELDLPLGPQAAAQFNLRFIAWSDVPGGTLRPHHCQSEDLPPDAYGVFAEVGKLDGGYCIVGFTPIETEELSSRLHGDVPTAEDFEFWLRATASMER